MSEKESKYFLITLLLIFFGLFVLILSGFFAPLILGIMLAGLAFPLYEELLKRWGNRKNLTSLIVVLLISLVIVLPVFGIMTLLTKEALGLLSATREQIFSEKLIGALDPFTRSFNFNAREIFETQLTPAIKNLGFTISKEIGGLLSDAVNLGLHFFVMLVTIFYMLRDGKAFANFLIEFSPLKISDELHLYQTFKDAGKAVFYGNFIASMVQGLLGGIGFVIFGLSSPVLWGAVMGFLALIPFLGPYLIFIPAGIYLIASGKITMAIIFLIYNLLIVSSIDNLIKPKLIGDKIKIHPLLILIAILGGLKIFGLIGIIYGPLIFSIFLALLDVYLKSSKVEIHKHE